MDVQCKCKTTWVADVLEMDGGSGMPKIHQFMLGDFLFAHQAEFCLRARMKEMPYKFNMQSIRLCFLFAKDGDKKEWVSVFPNQAV